MSLQSTIDAITGAGAAALGTGALAAIYKGYEDLGDLGDTAYDRSRDIAQQGLEQAEFKPFTVRSSTGGMFSADPGGNVTMGLGAQEQAIQNALMAQAQQGIAGGFGGDPMQQAAAEQAYGLGGQFMGMAGQDPMQRERDIYGNIRAMQSPEEQRQRMALEERLFNQGRGGVSTNMYGGTPEQLAMAKAQAEAQNQASLMAMQQAQAQQMQQADLGQRFGTLSGQLAGTGMGLQQAQQQLGLGALGASYLPEQQALGMLSAAAPYASIADIARRQGAGLYGETAMSGMDALMAGQLGQANLIGGIVPGVVQGLGNVATAGVKGLLDLLK